MNLFEEKTLRLKQQLKVTEDKQAAEALDLSAAAWTMRKKRENFPEKELYALAAKRPELNLDVSYVLSGVSANQVAAAVASVGSRIQILRGARNVGEFAAAFGLTVDTLERIEAGAQTPGATLMQDLIAAHPNVDVAWLFTGVGLPQPTALDPMEIILLTNYRASSPEGQAMLRQLAGSCAKYQRPD